MTPIEMADHLRTLGWSVREPWLKRRDLPKLALGQIWVPKNPKIQSRLILEIPLWDPKRPDRIREVRYLVGKSSSLICFETFMDWVRKNRAMPVNPLMRDNA